MLLSQIAEKKITQEVREKLNSASSLVGVNPIDTKPFCTRKSSSLAAFGKDKPAIFCFPADCAISASQG